MCVCGGEKTPSCPSVLYFQANMNALPCTSSPGSGRWATSREKNSSSQSDHRELGSLHVSHLDSRKERHQESAHFSLDSKEKAVSLKGISKVEGDTHHCPVLVGDAA